MFRSLKIPAKINLYLKVEGRRSDGYHDIVTLFAPLTAPVDTIELDASPNGGLKIRCEHPDVPEGPTNLCCRAAKAYAEAANIAGPNWRISLHKEIPVAAGMGGGSADAAATLRALNAEFQALSEDALRSLATELGADVPFFLDPRPALGRGTGEVLTPVPFAPGLSLVLAAPSFPVSARWAYQNYRPGRVAPPASEENILAAAKNGDWKALAHFVHNDLAAAVYEKFPLTALSRARLEAAGALRAEITGSGPTLFAIFPNPETARAAVETLRPEMPAVWFAQSEVFLPSPSS